MRLSDNRKLMVGYDLGNQYSQISYSLSEEAVETVSCVPGSENYNIPTVLCKRNGVNQWFFGQEAIRYAQEHDCILIENLLEKARDGEEILIEEKGFNPVALLTLFFKRSLSLLSMETPMELLDSLSITVDRLDETTVLVLNAVIANLKLDKKKITYQCHKESFYQYMLRQEEALWRGPAVLFFQENHQITAYYMECNEKTTPKVVFIEEQTFSCDAEKESEWDHAFLRIAQTLLEEKAAYSVFLVGEDFTEERIRDSIQYLCAGRRVFQGNNLFSKGACFGILEREQESEAGKNHVFLGNDKLKANIGMQILRQGEESYLALLDAGTNWYDAKQSIELYVQDAEELHIQVVSLVGKESLIWTIPLDGIRESIKRLKFQISMSNETTVFAEISDMGFGCIFPSEGHIWQQELEL